MNPSQHVLTQEIRQNLSARRDFVRQLGAASAGLAAFLASDGPMFGQSQITDADILQFALNLEYLEAEFYTVARTGMTIDQMGIGISGSGSAGQTTGGQKVTFVEGSTLADSADEIGANERAHVVLLRSALTAAGVQPAAKPAINLDALGTGFQSQEQFILLARAFEDVGVTAYAGAAPLIQNKEYLSVAARILASEAEHAGNLRLHTALYKVATSALDAVDIVGPPSGTKYISVDDNGLVAVRTPGQVLNVVYGGVAGAASGGFYPNGMNGNVKTSEAPAPAPTA